MSAAPTCNSCVFFHRTREGAVFGMCRRSAPTLVLAVEGARGIWPTTRESDFCGEHAIGEWGDDGNDT